MAKMSMIAVCLPSGISRAASALVGALMGIGAVDEFTNGALGPYGHHDTAKQNFSEIQVIVAAFNGNGTTLLQRLFATFDKSVSQIFGQGRVQCTAHAFDFPRGLQCIAAGDEDRVRYATVAADKKPVAPLPCHIADPQSAQARHGPITAGILPVRASAGGSASVQSIENGRRNNEILSKTDPPRMGNCSKTNSRRSSEPAKTSQATIEANSRHQ